MTSEATPTGVLKCFILLFLTECISCYSYPLFGSRRYLRTVPIRRSPYFQLSVPHHRNEFQLPDYDDELVTNPQDEYEYNIYEKYPYVQYFGYYPPKEYYRDKTVRRNSDGFDYFDGRISQEPDEELPEPLEKDLSYPYGQETWYEEEIPRYDSNAEANAAFLQNLIMAQMYQDAKNQRYESTADDYDDQHWFYGVPTTEVEEKEKVKQYFKNKEDEEVRELESLSRKKNKSKKLKEKDQFKKQKLDRIEKPTKPKSKMTDDEYFDMQKQLIVNSRKNSYSPVAEGLRLSKKQGVDIQNNFWDSHNAKTWPNRLESATNSIKKLNVNKNSKSTTVGVSDKEIKIEATAGVVSSTASSAGTSKRPVSAGQKEVVLPRPSNPVRRPFLEISSRSLHQPSVYDTIKRLLNMDKDIQKNHVFRGHLGAMFLNGHSHRVPFENQIGLAAYVRVRNIGDWISCFFECPVRKGPEGDHEGLCWSFQAEISQPQKRFVTNEDQLTAELSGLKKSA